MTKLTYINDQQIISDAAQMLIEAHLRWSGSNEGMPSKDRDRVSCLVHDAYLETNFTFKEWDELTPCKQTFHEEVAHALFKQAAQIADRKWEAAVILLGIEQ